MFMKNDNLKANIWKRTWFLLEILTFWIFSLEIIISQAFSTSNSHLIRILIWNNGFMWILTWNDHFTRIFAWNSHLIQISYLATILSRKFLSKILFHADFYRNEHFLRIFNRKIYQKQRNSLKIQRNRWINWY